MEWVEKGTLYTGSLALSAYLLYLLRLAVLKKIPRGFRLLQKTMDAHEKRQENRHRETMALMKIVAEKLAGHPPKPRTKPRRRATKKKRV